MSFFTKIGTKLKLKTNKGTKLNHFDTWHNCEVTCVKNSKIFKKFKKTRNWHVSLTFTLFGQN